MPAFDTAERVAQRYHGAPCKNCGSTERYRSSRSCIACNRRHGAAWVANNPERHKIRVRRYREVPENRARLNEHARRCRRGRLLPEPTRPCPSACENCGGDNQMKDGRRRALALDHDHATGKFRGWLCDLCNRGIGYFRDTPSTLRSAADYLERNS
jgi:hypothetical protein